MNTKNEDFEYNPIVQMIKNNKVQQDFISKELEQLTFDYWSVMAARLSDNIEKIKEIAQNNGQTFIGYESRITIIDLSNSYIRITFTEDENNKKNSVNVYNRGVSVFNGSKMIPINHAIEDIFKDLFIK